MAENNSDQFKVSDPEARNMIRQMAREDIRSYGDEIAWLARQEWARRYSTPQPCVTVDNALVAHAQASRSVGAVE